MTLVTGLAAQLQQLNSQIQVLRTTLTKLEQRIKALEEASP